MHIHSSHSDGVVTAAEVVRQASAGGLDTIAVTDHDAIGGLQEAGRTAQECGMKLVPGIELTADHHGYELHVLAYFNKLPAPGSPAALRLGTFLSRVQQARRSRIVKTVRELRLRGVPLLESEVFAPGSGCESYGRMHLARALFRAGHVRSEEAAFSSYLNEKQNLVPPVPVHPSELLDVVHECNGVTIWAHPGEEEYDRYIDELTGLGLDGVETNNFRKPAPPAVVEDALKRRLLVTGGSDWHGGAREMPLGSRAVDEQLLQPFFAALARRGEA